MKRHELASQRIFQRVFECLNKILAGMPKARSFVAPDDPTVSADDEDHRGGGAKLADAIGIWPSNFVSLEVM